MVEPDGLSASKKTLYFQVFDKGREYRAALNVASIPAQIK